MTERAAGGCEPDQTREIPSALAQVLGRWVYASDSAILVGNRAGIVAWANEAWSHITGRTHSQTVTKPVADFLIAADIDVEIVDFVQASFARGARCEVELPFTTPDGRNAWFHLTVDPVRDAFGEVGEFVAVAEDITARKMQELAEGREAPAKRETLPARASSELLAESSMARVDLSALCQEAIAGLRPELDSHTQLDLVLHDSLPKVLVDPAQLSLVISEVLRGGADAMGAEWGTLSVTTRLIDSDRRDSGGLIIPSETFPGAVVTRGLHRFPYAALEVHDTGRCLSGPLPAMLSVARTILRAHDGDLFVDSAAGCGTRVLALMPV